MDKLKIYHNKKGQESLRLKWCGGDYLEYIGRLEKVIFSIKNAYVNELLYNGKVSNIESQELLTWDNIEKTI